MSSDDHSLKSFLSDLSAPVFAPGGGAAAALTAALSSSLLCMAASLTANNARFSEYREELLANAEKLDQLNSRFLCLIDRDAEAFEPLSRIYKLPKDSEGYEEKKRDAVLFACSIPEELLLCTKDVCSILEEISKKCSSSLLSDICCAAYLTAAAAKCAAVTIFANTTMIPDTPDANRIESETRAIVKEINSLVTDTAEGFFTSRKLEVL